MCGAQKDPIRLLLDGDDESALVALIEKKEHDAADQMAAVSDWFGDNLAKRVKALSEGEKGTYAEQARYLFSEMKGYGNPHFIKNFFDYISDKTKGMEDKLKRRFILVAHTVYKSAVHTLDKKAGEGQDVDSLFDTVGPLTEFTTDLGFDRDGYEKLREMLCLGIEREVFEDPRFDREFYNKKTVGDVVELIFGIKKVSGSKYRGREVPHVDEVGPEDIYALQRCLREGAEALGFKDEPKEAFTEQSLVMKYLILQQPKLASSTPDFVKDYLEMLEGQASWIVLRRFESDERIASYKREERQRRFIGKLYEHRDKFIFFESREKALTNLSSLEIISADDYKP